MKLNQTVYLIILLVFQFVPVHGARGYYFSQDGNDGMAGSSAVTAWKSLGKLNSILLAPGDSILLEGGDTLESAVSLKLHPGNFPFSSPSTPLIISAFPFGGTRAALRISASDQHGIDLYHVQGIEISNLHIIGPGAVISKGEGINAYTDSISGTRLRHIYIDQCETQGFKNGICVGTWPWNSSSFFGYDGVRITRCVAHDNTGSGITSYGMWPDSPANRSNRNFYVGYCKAYNNKGDPSYTNNHSGSGIVMGNVSGMVIEYCEAYNNGEFNASTRNNGPVGIWLWSSDNSVIQHCISHNNKSGNNCDGGGFDIDGGAEACTLQYNYSYSNVGAGYLICQFDMSAPFTKNVVRYNISQNDGSAGKMGGIHFWSAGATGIADIKIYGNTIWSSVAPAVYFQTTSGINGVKFWNNLFMTTSGKAMVLGNPTTAVAKFEGNAYWPGGSAFSAGGYSNLAAWQSAMGQEKISINTTGINVNPMVTNPGAGAALTDPSLLATLQAYKLQSGSPLINTGQNIAGINPGKRDFWGNSVPNGNFDIGAHEAVTIPGVAFFSSRQADQHFQIPVLFDVMGKKVSVSDPGPKIRIDRRFKSSRLRFME